MLETLLSFDPAILVTFILAGLLLNLTPGADFLLVTSTGIRGGPKAGCAAAAGVTLGILVHIVLAAGGVSALLLAYPSAYDAIRIGGGLYLAFIAWRAWRAGAELAPGRGERNLAAAFRRGFLTNVLNPKTALFIFAFIPQFADPATGPLWQQILLLGAIFAINGFIFVILLGLAAGLASEALAPRLRLLNRLTAILFGGLAARLLLD